MKAHTISNILNVIVVTTYLVIILVLGGVCQLDADRGSTIGISIWGPFWNGSKYAFISTFFQIAAGFSAAMAFTITSDHLISRRRRTIQMAIDGVILIPYMIPSIAWVWLYKLLAGPSSGLYTQLAGFFKDYENPNAAYSILFLHIVSVLHLFPFGYLGFRMFFSSLNPYTKVISTQLGLSTPEYILRIYGKTLVKIISLMFLIRYFIMFGKFDLPEKILSGELLDEFNIPLWAKHRLLPYDLSHYAQTFSILPRLVFGAMIAIIGVKWVRDLRNNRYGQDLDVVFGQIANAIARILLILREKVFKSFWPVILRTLTCMVKILGVLVVTFSLYPIIVAVITYAQMSELILVLRENYFIISFGRTIIYLILAVLCARLVGYSLFIFASTQRGWLVQLTFVVLGMIYMMPSVAYYPLFDHISEVLHSLLKVNAEPLVYSIYLMFMTIPLSFFILMTTLPKLTSQQVLLLRGGHKPLGEVYMELHRPQYSAGMGMVVLVAVIIGINEVFGAYYYLDGASPVSLRLWESLESSNYNMYNMFSKMAIVFFLNYVIFIISSLVYKNRIYFNRERS